MLDGRRGRGRGAEVEGIRVRGRGTLWWMREEGGGLYGGWEKTEGGRG